MSDWTDDFLNSSQFPNRPNHPDFWRLSEIVLQLDAAVLEDGVTVDSEVEKEIDVASLNYMAEQTALRVLQVLVDQVPPPLRPAVVPGMMQELVPLIDAAWKSGFVVGSRFQTRGGRQ